MDQSQRALLTNRKLFICKFLIRFRFFGRKPNNIQRNSEALILIKVQCVIIYQWIRLDKLYKLIERYFSNFGIIFTNRLQFFLKIIVALGLCMQGGGGICVDKHAFYFTYTVHHSIAYFE